jgi:site-specific DNA-cytosine methylase
MKVLIACEFSGIVREAFRRRGHDVWSCDILPSELPGNHFQARLEDKIGSGSEWDLIIAHPPCTYLCSSGYHWNSRRPEREQDTERALYFVFMIWARLCKKIAIENPVGILSRPENLGKPAQYIQPYEYGHPESKRTCLWLKGLPLLKPTNILPLPESGRWDNQTASGQNKLTPSPTRGLERSRTYQGWAEAMAMQWG